MKRITIGMLLIGLLLACARPTVTYREYMSNPSAPAQTNARFILFRPKDSLGAKLQGGARSVRIKIDDQLAGYVGGGFKIFDVATGKHTISVDLWDTPGSCQLEFETVAGGEYYFQIGPRRELAAEALGDLVAALIVDSVGIGPTIIGAAVLGTATKARVNFCNGDFSIKAIQKEVAASKFAELKRN